MKLRHLLSILVVILVMTGFAPAALADEVRITVTANPTELTEAGNVELSFSISNFSDYQLHDITISSAGVVYDLGQNPIEIPMGGSAYDIKIAYRVQDAQIGLTQTFTVSWIQGGEPRSQDVPVTIARAADPIISLARTPQATMAKQGDTIMIDYVLTNSTVFDMTDITLIDEGVSDNAICRYDVLRAGNSITIQHLFTMGENDVVSAPVITYTVNGKIKTFSAIEPMTLRLMLVKTTLDVSQSTPTAAGVTFTLVLRNDGNQDLSGVQITDERGVALIAVPGTLRAGEALTSEYTVVPDVNEPVRNVAFTVTATDPFGGSYTLTPEKSYEIYPFVDDAQIQTSLRVDVIEPWTAESGSIKVRVTLVNYSEVPISNVQISETTLGLIAQIPSLQSGENSVEQIIPLGSPRNLAFSAKGVDPTGTMRELCAFSLSVAYEDAGEASQTAAPTLKPDDSKMEHTIGAIAGTLSKVLIVLGVIMTIAFIGMLVLSVMERSRMLQLKKDAMELSESEKSRGRKLARAVDRDAQQHTKSIWIERDHTLPATGAPSPMRRAPQPFYRPVEVEYDDGNGAEDAEYDDAPDTFEDAVEYGGMRFVRSPHADDTADFIDVDYERADQPERAAGPKTIRIKAEPVVQPKMKPTVKRIGGLEQNDGSEDDDQ